MQNCAIHVGWIECHHTGTCKMCMYIPYMRNTELHVWHWPTLHVRVSWSVLFFIFPDALLADLQSTTAHISNYQQQHKGAPLPASPSQHNPPAQQYSGQRQSYSSARSDSRGSTPPPLPPPPPSDVLDGVGSNHYTEQVSCLPFGVRFDMFIYLHIQVPVPLRSIQLMQTSTPAVSGKGCQQHADGGGFSLDTAQLHPTLRLAAVE